MVDRLSRQAGLDPRLVDALVRAESDYNPRALSRKGAMGLMQLMPQTARRLNVDDPYDPEQNVRGGVQEFSRLIERYSGNLGLALAAYNAGEGAVSRHQGIPPYRETRNYVSTIMENYTGRPYRLGSRRMMRIPVRLQRDLASGTVLITNVSGVSRSGSISIASKSGGSLGGGFGK
jgi:soluble lytic murein transglycosylase-like protein